MQLTVRHLRLLAILAWCGSTFGRADRGLVDFLQWLAAFLRDLPAGFVLGRGLDDLAVEPAQLHRDEAEPLPVRADLII